MANWWQSRIVGHAKIDPEALNANPLNHRLHPKKQRDVVRDSIVEIGFIKSVLVNKTTGLIIDGHERVHQAIAAKRDDPTVAIDVEYVELPPIEEDDVPEPPAEPITKLGDLWLLGAYFECEGCGKHYEYDEGKAMGECPCV